MSQGSCHTGLGLGAGFLCQMEKKSTHWWPHGKPCSRGAGAALALLWPHTDALADAWTEVQRQEGSWEGASLRPILHGEQA